MHQFKHTTQHLSDINDQTLRWYKSVMSCNNNSFRMRCQLNRAVTFYKLHPVSYVPRHELNSSSKCDTMVAAVIISLQTNVELHIQNLCEGCFGCVEMHSSASRRTTCCRLPVMSKARRSKASRWNLCFMSPAASLLNRLQQHIQNRNRSMWLTC